MKKVILITGASSGIGKTTALKFLSEDYIVYGLARSINKMKYLTQAGGKVMEMDVTKPIQVAEVVNLIIHKEQRIDVLINSAGYAIYGAIEHTSYELAKRQFEVNLFGMAEVTKAVLPVMRKQKSGKIINISSIGGKVYSPLGGWYHATKHAVEGWSDCLRVETKEFGIDTIIIEPGTIKTNFGQTRLKNFVEPENSPYSRIAESMKKVIANGYKPGNYSEPEVVSNTIFKAANSNNPKTRYTTGKRASSTLFFRKLFTDKFMDKMIYRTLKNTRAD